jgi:putative lumazine-binding protein
MTTETTPRIASTNPISSEDDAEIRATIDDYYLGWYDADGERMGRALHPELAKRGWYAIAAAPAQVDPDTRTTMVEAAAAGMGKRTEAQGGGYRVEIDDVYGDVAAAVVHAVPFIDYLHLVRTPDGWRILNALWCPTLT